MPILALAVAVLFKLGVFKARTQTPGEAVKLLFLVVTTVVWLGSIDAAREIIKEKRVFVREPRSGSASART